jgi:hypothetical protein
MILLFLDTSDDEHKLPSLPPSPPSHSIANRASETQSPILISSPSISPQSSPSPPAHTPTPPMSSPSPPPLPPSPSPPRVPKKAYKRHYLPTFDSDDDVTLDEPLDLRVKR